MMHMAREMVYHVGDILHEFLGHNFVSGLRRLKSKKNFKTFFLKFITM